MEMTKKEIGDLGEDYAAKYLRSKGCEILARNYRIRGGEIDIIARLGNVLHIVEVKSRKPSPLTSGEEAISPRKQALLINAAGEYIKRNGLDISAIFDVATVEIDEGKVISFKYIQRAFTA